MADWTGRQLAIHRRMWMDGATPEEISAATGRSVKAVLEMRRRQKLPPRRDVASAVGLPTYWLPIGLVVHVGGIPYRHLGGGKIEGATPLSTALELETGPSTGVQTDG